MKSFITSSNDFAEFTGTAWCNSSNAFVKSFSFMGSPFIRTPLSTSMKLLLEDNDFINLADAISFTSVDRASSIFCESFDSSIATPRPASTLGLRRYSLSPSKCKVILFPICISGTSFPAFFISTVVAFSPLANGLVISVTLSQSCNPLMAYLSPLPTVPNVSNSPDAAAKSPKVKATTGPTTEPTV